MAASVCMPLINSCFEPGQARACAMAIEDADARNIALSELAYFQGRPADALELARPYLNATDPGLKTSACLLSVYANLPLGQIAQARHAMGLLEEPLPAQDKRAAAYSAFALSAARTLLHLEAPPTPPTHSQLALIGEGNRMFCLYVVAHRAYLQGEWSYALGCAESALAMPSGQHPIPQIYLHLVACMAAMSLKQIDRAKGHFARAWELSKPDRLIEGIAEHHGLLGGLIETLVKPANPEAYHAIIDITYRFSAGWRRMHNPCTGEDVADNLTTTEFSIAMLLNRDWTVREVATFLEVSENTVKTHAKSIYRKLGISTRKELGRFMLR